MIGDQLRGTLSLRLHGLKMDIDAVRDGVGGELPRDPASEAHRLDAGNVAGSSAEGQSAERLTGALGLCQRAGAVRGRPRAGRIAGRRARRAESERSGQSSERPSHHSDYDTRVGCRVPFELRAWSSGSSAGSRVLLAPCSGSALPAQAPPRRTPPLTIANHDKPCQANAAHYQPSPAPNHAYTRGTE